MRNDTKPFIRNLYRVLIALALVACTGVALLSLARVAQAASSDARLGGILLSSGTLDPDFAPGTIKYSADVINSVSGITVTATVYDPNATVTVDGYNANAKAVLISLIEGENAITIVVTAGDGVTTKTYTVQVYRDSTDATLGDLALSEGALDPIFDPDTTGYTATVSSSVDSITVTPTVHEKKATVTVNGDDVASGQASGPISLDVGDNTITIEVTASDDTTTMTYAVTVTRQPAALSALALSLGALDPDFAASTIDYSDNVGSADSVTVTPTAKDPNDTITVDGTTVASGAASDSITLAAGDNPISIVVSSEDGATTKTYTVDANRIKSGDDSLSDLSLSSATLDPAFDSGINDYTATVSSSVDSITATPTVNEKHATVTVNGTPVDSGQASGPIALSMGGNTITVVVTAEEGTFTKTYTVTVTRPTASSDATLGGLALSDGTIAPSFAPGDTAYTATVGQNVDSITVTPSVNEPDAIVAVNGTPVDSGAASEPISLNEGDNAISVVVTASDGATTMTYTVTVTRQTMHDFDLPFGANGSTAFSVIQASNGDFVFTGTTTTATGPKFWLARTDNCGNLKWQQTYGDDGLRQAVGRSVYQTSDDGFIIAGTWQMSGAFGTYPPDDKIYLIKTDANGNEQWAQKLHIPSSYSDGYSVYQTSDGGYIVAGVIFFGDMLSGSTNAWVVTTDSGGNMTNQNPYGVDWSLARSMAPTSDGGYVAAGNYGQNLAYVIKLNADGSEAWERSPGTPGATYWISSICQTTDGGYALTGIAYKTGGGALLMKLDQNGKETWEQTYALGLGRSVQQTASGNYIITGNASPQGIYVLIADSKGNKVREQYFGSGGDTGYCVRETQDGGYVIAGALGGQGCLIYSKPALQARLGVSSPNVLQNGAVLIYATVLNDDGSIDTRGNADVQVSVTGIADPVELKDDGAGGDFHAQDGVYGAYVQIPGPGPAKIDLTVGGDDQGSTTVNVITDPTLAVITDLAQLYNEFKNTGHSFGISPNDDTDNNGIPDYYDLLNRLNQYAANHHGIVFDLPQEITAANGYQDYGKPPRVYGNENHEMCRLIQQFTSNVGTATHFKYLAIIGDDMVVPFYRRDAVNGEDENKYGDDNASYNNVTLQDSSKDYIMTDVPYASYDGTDPDQVAKPRPDVGFGRIFANIPSILTQMINGYESKISVIPGTSTAAMFSEHDDTVDFKDNANTFLKPVLNMYFGNSTGNNNYTWKDGNAVNWSPGDVANSVSNNLLTIIFSHATHMRQNSSNPNGPSIQSSTFYGMHGQAPGHVLIDVGCHAGYSVSYTPAANCPPYDIALVNSIIRNQVTYIAPTTYGLTQGSLPLIGYTYDFGHPLLFKLIMENMFNKNEATVGDAFKDAYPQYWAKVNALSPDRYSTFVTYGTELYGLPTQPVDPPPPPLAATTPTNSTAGKAVVDSASDPSLSFSVDIPNFKVTTDSEGKSIFQVPGDGSSVVNAFAPCIPLVQKSFLLPAGAVVNNVNLTGVSSYVYQGQYDLLTETPVSETSGPIQGSFTIPNPYPENIFWYNTAPADGGVMLTVSIAPMQYDPDTKQVTLFNHLQFDVDYTSPSTGLSIGNLVVNNGASLQTGMADVPVSVNISSSVNQDATLLWEVRDRSGDLLDSGNQDLQLGVGDTVYSINTSTRNWSPGPKDLTVALSVYGSIVDSQTVAMTVYGIGLDASMDRDVYYPAETTGSASVEVRDELGAPVTGLGGTNFNLTVDGATVAATVYAGGADGTYSLDFPLGGVGQHALVLNCTDSRGITASTSLTYAVVIDTTPPTVSSVTPDTNATGVPVDASISVNFSESVQKSVNFSGIVLQKPDGTAVPGDLQLSGYGLALTPSSDLDTNTMYTLVIPAGAIKDLAGNDLAFSFTSYFFTSQIAVGPQVVDTSPDDGTKDVLVNAPAGVTFDKSVQQCVYYSQIDWEANGSPVAFTPLISGRTLILTPNEPVPYGASCTITVPAGAVMDLSGNETLNPYSFSFTMQTLPGQLPQVPTGITAMPVSSSEIDLGWQSVAGATYYNIYRSLDQSGAYNKIGSCQTAGYIDSGLAAATPYWYKLTTVNGVGESVFSAVYGATTLSGGGGGDTLPPFWPPGSSLSYQGLTSSELTLNWTPAEDNVGVVHYAAYENGALVTNAVAGSVYSFQVTGLAPGTPYNFRVEAGDAAGNWSTGGPTLQVTTPAPVISSNATLSGLDLLYGVYTPTFASNTFNYQASVASDVYNDFVRPTAADPTSTIQVNGFSAASGQIFGPISLAYGANNIVIKVTAQDGTVETYTLAVIRAPLGGARLQSLYTTIPLDQNFMPDTTFLYTAQAPYATDSFTVSAAVYAEVYATVYIDGIGGLQQVSETRNLAVGPNSVVISVYSQDGSSVDYVINVLRAAQLTVASVSSIPDITVAYGTALSSTGLPGSVVVNLSDHSTPSLNVVWNAPPYDPHIARTYAFSGSLTLPDGVANPNGLQAHVNVIVQQQLPYLASLVLTGPAPSLAAGGSAYDLKGLALAGLDQYDQSFDISKQTVAWSLTTGSTGASLAGSILTPVSAGSGSVTASIGDVTSNAATYSVSPATPPAAHLASLVLSGSPSLTYNNASFTYDLTGLTLAGKDQNGAAYDITGQTATWSVVSGPATAAGHTLTITDGGLVTVNAAIGRITSNNLGLTVGSAAPPAAYLASLVLTGPAPSLTAGGSAYDLKGLALAGLDQYGQSFDISKQTVAWSLTTGSTGASLAGSILTPVSAGSGSVTASIGDVTSNAATYSVSAPSSPGGGGGGGGVPAAAVPTVQTAAATGITVNSATLNGSITSSGAAITEYGFLWGTASGSLNNTLKVGTDNHAGAFTATLSNVQAGTTYYFQAYAKNANSLYKGDPKQFTTVSEVLPPPVPAPVFSDVPATYWALDAINDLSIRGYIYGYPDGAFRPDSVITRAEFVSILNRALKLSKYNPAASDFSDSFPEDWFYGSVENTTHAGIVYGYGDTTFGPGKPITREEMACILVQAMGEADEARSKMSARTDFLDDRSIAGWSRGFVVVAVEHGLMGYPDHTFKPKTYATRAEACAMISNLLGIHK